MDTDKEFDDAIQQPSEPMIRYRITDEPNKTAGRWEFNNASSDDKEWHPFSASKEYVKDNIEFGIDGTGYTWNGTILTCTHNLNVQIPYIVVYVTPKTGTEEELSSIEMAIVPHSYTKGDLNHVKIDFEGFENYYITIKMLA